jgi:hypothetical protein
VILVRTSPEVRGVIAERAGKARREMRFLFDDPGSYGPRPKNMRRLGQGLPRKHHGGRIQGSARICLSLSDARRRPGSHAGTAHVSFEGCNTFEMRASHIAARVNRARRARSDEGDELRVKLT